MKIPNISGWGLFNSSEVKGYKVSQLKLDNDFKLIISPVVIGGKVLYSASTVSMAGWQRHGLFKTKRKACGFLQERYKQ